MRPRFGFFMFLALLTLFPTKIQADGGSNSDSDGKVPTSSIEFPPPAPGVADNQRVYVRTSAVNPTEYLELRILLVEAGFPDSLESAPGSFIVDLDGRSFEEALPILMDIPKVVEVAKAPDYASLANEKSLDYPTWWWFVPVSLLSILGLYAFSNKTEKTDTSASQA
jgi:hypothetical protein